MNSELTSEELLLIGLCRLNFNEKEREELLFLAEKVTDWVHFSKLANMHGVASLAGHNILKTGISDLLPSEVSGFLRNASMLSLARNAALFNMITEVASVLDSKGIKIVFLKGLALELTVYGNSGLRQMSDCDILVRYEESMKAYRILRKKGFEFFPVKSLLYKLIIRHTGKHFPSIIRNGMSVDLHCRLMDQDHEWFNKEFRDNCTEKEIEGIKVLIPAPLYHFIFLLHHLNSHELRNESQLRLYTDLAILIEKYPHEILNNNLTNLTGRLGMNEILASKLMILRDFRGVALPDWLDEFTGKWKNENTRTRFLQFLKNTQLGSNYDKPLVYRNVLADIPGFHRKALFVLGDMFPTFEFMKKRYGCKSSWQTLVYYPHRLGKIFWLFR
jgi:hypothetical protein